jgi:hypothetical protein
MRLLFKNPVRIPLHGTETLAVSKSEDGVLWWFHGGQLIRTETHYRFMDTQGPTESVLEISDAQYPHGGIYEVVLKSGECELRNLILVDIEGRFAF